MIALLIFSTVVSTMSAAAQGTAAGAANDYVRLANNGEFLSDYYPEGALKRGEQGRVGFRISVEKEGWIGSCEVSESSGFTALDRETCEIIVQYARVKPVRDPDGRPVRALQTGYISWRLPSSVRLARPSRLTRRPDPIVCRRDNAIGSLVAKTIQCLSRSEWELQQQFMKDAFQELQGKGHTNGGG